jgi:hypothetical protein
VHRRRLRRPQAGREIGHAHYRLSEPPRRAGQGIRFSLDPTGRASGTGLNTVGNDDGSLSVGAAGNQCEVARQMRLRR